MIPLLLYDTGTKISLYLCECKYSMYGVAANYWGVFRKANTIQVNIANSQSDIAKLSYNQES